MQPVMQSRRTQRGVGLVEALIAFLVLSLGLVGLAKLQSHLRLNADIARQRSEAVQLAEENIETLRSFSSIPAAPGARSWADVVPTSSASDPADQSSGTRYSIERRVDEEAGFRTLGVTVAWNDRAGQPQRVLLQSIVAATPPALSGALATRAASDASLKRVNGRSTFIPLSAKDLGDGRSVFKPSMAGSIALVFDNATGAVIERCDQIAIGTTSANLGADALAHCSPRAGLLLSGIVRLSLASPPDAAHANDTPLPLSVALALSSPAAEAPLCVSEAQKLVAFTTPAGTRREAVALDATPASVGVSAWRDLGERFVAYHCVVPAPPGGWSGRSTVVAQDWQGWSIGLAANQFKVCRYSADHDGSGAIDRNDEHPGEYRHVEKALTQQNFLIVKGSEACPAASASFEADSSTVQHQP